MTNPIRELVIKVTVETELDGLDDANKGIEQVGDQAKQTSREVGKLEGFTDKLSESLSGLGPALIAGGFAAALVVAGEAIAFVTERTAELDAISKTAQKTGFSTEDIQIFTQVATLSGTEIGFLTKGVTNLEIQLDKLSKGGGGPAAEALEDLGLKFDALKDKDPTEQFKIISTALEGIPDPTDKSRIAFGLMGEEGRQLIPLFNSGADAIDTMVASTGKIFTDEDIKKAEDYQDALAGMTKVWTDLTGEVAVGAAPTLQAIVELITDTAPEARKLAAEVVEKLQPAFERLVEAIKPFVDGDGEILITILGKLAQALKVPADAVAFFATQLAFLLETGNTVTTWIDGMLERLETKFPRAFAAAESAVNAIIHPLETARAVVVDIFEFIERAAGQIEGISSRVQSIRATLGLDTDDDPAADPTPTAAPTSAQPDAATEATAAVRNAEAGIRARTDFLARRADAEARAALPRRRTGGGGGGGSATAPSEEIGIDALIAGAIGTATGQPSQVASSNALAGTMLINVDQSVNITQGPVTIEFEVPASIAESGDIEALADALSDRFVTIHALTQANDFFEARQNVGPG